MQLPYDIPIYPFSGDREAPNFLEEETQIVRETRSLLGTFETGGGPSHNFPPQTGVLPIELGHRHPKRSKDYLSRNANLVVLAFFLGEYFCEYPLWAYFNRRRTGNSTHFGGVSTFTTWLKNPACGS